MPRRRASGSLVKKRLSAHASIATLTGRYAPLHGYLEKRSTKGKWQRRWFDAHDAYLTYRHDEHAKKNLGVIDLRTCGSIVARRAEKGGGTAASAATQGEGEDELGMGYFSVQLEARTYELRVPTPWTEDTKLAGIWVAGLLERKNGAVGNGNGDGIGKDTGNDNEDGEDGWGGSGGGSFGGGTASTFHEYDPSADIDHDVVHATKKIQSVVRARSARKHTHEKSRKHHASKKIQSAMRGRKGRKHAKEMKRADTATRKIQSAMRGRKARKDAAAMRRVDTAKIMLATKKRISRKSTSERLTASFDAEEAKVRAQLDAFYHDREAFEKKAGVAGNTPLSLSSSSPPTSLQGGNGKAQPSSPGAVVAFEMDKGGAASVGVPMHAASDGAAPASGGCWGCCSCLLPSAKNGEASV